LKNGLIVRIALRYGHLFNQRHFLFISGEAAMDNRNTFTSSTIHPLLSLVFSFSVVGFVRPERATQATMLGHHACNSKYHPENLPDSVGG
jgi:hypothetical protein